MPAAYNLQKGIRRHHPELWAPETAFILHYTDVKPWQGMDHPENKDHEDIVKWWWKVFENKSDAASGHQQAGTARFNLPH